MAATQIGNVITLDAAGESLADLYASDAELTRVFANMVITALGTGGDLIFTTDDGAQVTLFTVAVGAGVPIVIPGPMRFSRGLRIGTIPAGTTVNVLLFE